MLVPQHGYLQYLDLASNFDSRFSANYCDQRYLARVILDTGKKHLGCQCHWKLETNQCVWVRWVSAVEEVPFDVEG